MKTLAEIRAEYPQYKDVSDKDLADAIYDKFYPDMERSEFDSLAMPAESSALDYVRAAGQGVTFGFGDELAAIARSVGDETYEEALAAERASLEKFREESPYTAYGLEIAGSIPSSLLGVGLLGRAAQVGSKVAPVLSKVPTAVGTALATGAEGALYGAGAAEEGQRLTGAGVGGAVGGVLGGAAGAVLPKISEAAKGLIREGVPLTAGQAMGGGVRVIEEGLGAVPVVKGFVADAKARVTEGFTSAAMNRALSPLDKKLSKDLSGTQAFDDALEIISKEYERVIPSLNVGSSIDMKNAVQRGIREAVEAQPTLVGRDLEEFNQIINNIFSKLPKSGKVEGKILKEIESRLGSSAKMKFKSGRPDTAIALNEVKSAFRDELARQDTTGSAALAKVNEAYRNILPIEKSVNKAIAESGAFTPKQLLQSMKQDSPRMAARGRMTDQDFSQAAQDIIGRKSGEGSLVAPLTGLAIGQQALVGNIAPAAALVGGSLLAAPAYSRAGVPVTRGLLNLAGRTTETLAPVSGGLIGGAPLLVPTAEVTPKGN